MPLDVPRRLADRARQYHATAESARAAGHLDAAFENARTAAELACKSLLEHAGVPYPEEHNVAGAMVRHGLWTRGRAAPLSKLLQEYVRGVYSLHRPVSGQEARRATQLAGTVIAAAERRLAP